MSKTILVAGVLALIVAGCAKEDVATAPSPAQGADTAIAATAAIEAEPCVQDEFYSPLPDPEIRFQFPFRVARDRVYESDNGKPRRGLSLEYLEGSADGIWDAVVASMAAAGFEQAQGVEDEPYRGTFKKGGAPSIFAKVDGEAGSNPTGTDVKGSIWLSWGTDGGDASSAP
ncbi:hypothetical protein ACFONC_01430 [Luteimonas soli]|uniref:Uncharacterized protein n=1 Tax=Luteimonas soli TaxID=1648966 RepID=A0ABV7XHP7_9GAMM